MEHPFSWFQLVAGPEWTIVVTAWFVTLLLIALAFVARAQLNSVMAQQGPERYLPTTSLSPRGIFELLTSGLNNMVTGVLGPKDGAKFFPLLAGLFTYILFNNLVGAIPGVLPATENFNTNLAMGLSIFLVFNIAGLIWNGTGYIKHMMGPVWWLAPVMLVIEMISFAIRPVSLSVRLTANIFSDHLMFGIISGLVPIVVPVIFLGFGLFVSFVQAFVFTLLSTIYIGMAVAHEDHGDEHHEGKHH